MRNYWIKILLGAFAIFAIGMIGVTIVRKGIAKVNRVVDSDDSITIPLAFVPFTLGGERLGTLQHLTVERSSPREVSGVELEVDLGDSLVATGLSGCRLLANIESDSSEPGINIHASKSSKDTFACIPGDSTPPNVVDFGEAVFQPGEVRVRLYVPVDLVAEVNRALAHDSLPPELEARADSMADLAELKSDSAVQAAIRTADSVGRRGRRLGDSLRAEARKQMREQMADSSSER
jgi:hypothetical protein